MTDVLPTSAPARRRQLPALPAARPSRALVVTVGGVVLASVAAVVLTAGSDPVVVPDTVAGLSRVDGDFGSDGSWRSMMAPVYGDDDFAGQAYRSAGGRFQQLHVVVVAGDGAGKGDLESAGQAREQFGSVTCAPMSPGGTALSDPPELDLCWRSSPDLTVTVLSLGTPPGGVGDVVSAVHEVWRAQR